MSENFLFKHLAETVSTNNDANALIRSGNPPHGMAIFADFQSQGKGQRGQRWESEPGQNLLLSVILKNPASFRKQPFVLSMLLALTCRQWLAEHLTIPVYIKWPNDIIVADRKAGGILIETIYRGSDWTWAVAGIGINIHQEAFPQTITHAISLKQVTGKTYQTVAMAKQLQARLVEAFENYQAEQSSTWVDHYNQYLYKKHEQVLIEEDQKQRLCRVERVDEKGHLHIVDVTARTVQVGEITWIWDDASTVD